MLIVVIPDGLTDSLALGGKKTDFLIEGFRLGSCAHLLGSNYTQTVHYLLLITGQQIITTNIWYKIYAGHKHNITARLTTFLMTPAQKHHRGQTRFRFALVPSGRITIAGASAAVMSLSPALKRFWSAWIILKNLEGRVSKQ